MDPSCSLSTFLPRSIDATVQWVMHHDWPAGQMYLDDGRMESYTLWMIQCGEVHVELGGESLVVSEGNLFLSPMNTKRRISTPRGARWISVALQATILGGDDLIGLMRPPAIMAPDPETRAILGQFMAQLHHEWAGATNVPTVNPYSFDRYIEQHYGPNWTVEATSVMLCDAYIRAIIAICWRHWGRVSLEHAAGQSMPEWVPTMLRQLREHPDISIDHLAQDIGISVTQLRRQCRKWVGASPREYLNRLRLEDARQMLQSTERPINEIAEQIGFLSRPHFDRVFKTQYGLPPAQYRHLSRMNGAASPIK